MKKPLLFSLAALSVLSSGLSAETMYERFQTMEAKMQQMQKELEMLKAQKAQSEDDEKDSDVEAEDDNEDMQATDDENEAEDDEAKDEDTADDEEDDSEDDDEDSIEDIIGDIQENLSELNKGTNGNHLKFNVDYRFSVENLNYKLANGETKSNDAFMANRFWMNMNWSATHNLSFHAQLAYNKAFGARSMSLTTEQSMENFDWIVNENAYDGEVRVRSLYFLYKNDTFIGTNVPWTFSIGRRPSTNGHLVNLREDDNPSSPMGHTINVEFDGMSAKFGLEDVIGVEGMYIKLCAGRGLTNAEAKMGSPTPYATSPNALPDIDLAGLIFVPYDNGQYSINTQYYYANNLIDADFNATGARTGFSTVGGMHSFTANIIANGVGDEWSDYLDDTTFFISGAISRSDPKDRGLQTGMFGSADAKTGYSVWIGLQMPSLMSEDGRWGVEYNKGSQYWRSITYAEDTSIGSKLAARGDAYEVYFTEPIIEEILSVQLRYTYIDYKYTGSNGFFGNTTGNAMLIDAIPASSPMAANVVDKAQDIRFYIRYRY